MSSDNAAKKTPSEKPPEMDSVNSDSLNDVEGAFREAKENEVIADNVLQLEAAKVDELLEEEPVQVNRDTKRKDGNKPSVLALVVSFVAIGLAGYSVVDQKMVSSDVNAKLENISIEVEKIPEIISVQEELVELKEKIESSTELQELINRTNRDLVAAQKKIENVAIELNANNVTQSMHSEEIVAIQEHLKKLSKEMKGLTNRPKITRVPKKRNRVIVKAPVIGGASLATIDIWGGVVFAILKDVSGDLVPVARGDFYKDWQLVSIGVRKVTFKKGKIKKSLKQKV
ncbi:MAG: hypothetical protein QM500_10645 [Methylococcales bacterium]